MRCGAILIAAAAIAACGTSPLTISQFSHESARICQSAREGIDAFAPASEVRRAHAGALKRIRALETEASVREQVAPGLERLANQAERLAQLERADASGARPARLLELAGAVELEQRLAGATPFAGCLALGAGVVEPYLAVDYARRARALLHRGDRIVANPAWRKLLSDDPPTVHATARLAFDRIYGDFESHWLDLTPPRALKPEHRAVRLALDAMTDAVFRAEKQIGVSNGSFAKARRMLRRFPAARREYRRAAAALREAIDALRP